MAERNNTKFSSWRVKIFVLQFDLFQLKFTGLESPQLYFSPFIAVVNKGVARLEKSNWKAMNFNSFSLFLTLSDNVVFLQKICDKCKFEGYFASKTQKKIRQMLKIIFESSLR